jgi:hypothetical protein
MLKGLEGVKPEEEVGRKGGEANVVEEGGGRKGGSLKVLWSRKIKHFSW